MPKFGGAPKCPRCSKSVYKAEEVIALGKSWHKMCFTCASCRKGLSSTNVCDAKGEVWCRACYGKNFGPKGYGYGGGAGILQMSDPVTPGVVKSTPKPKIKPAPSRGTTASAGLSCSSCGASVAGKFCSECGEAAPKPKPKPPSNGCSCGAPLKAGVKFCTQCGKKNTIGRAPVSAFSKLSVASVGEGKKKKKKPKFGGAEKCHRCGKSVYSAEKQLGAGFTWHKACFTCKNCGKGLSSTNLCEKAGEIYDSACYGKLFGPKGFGYGQGAGALAHTQ
uniref:LIM zinc-binding domain-containing protein n=1 Tax=Lotharella globosa TaxID=91324 RepID=A0A7S3YDB8_9EUKA